MSQQATDGSATLTTAGSAQTLFGGATPVNGFAIYNPDAVNDLWASHTTTAAAHAQGSVRIIANGGWWELPTGVKPAGPVSVVPSANSQAITAYCW